MRVYLDSNLIVALLIGEHGHHPRARAIYERVAVEKLTVCTSAHALLESTLNAARRYNRPAGDVWTALNAWRTKGLGSASDRAEQL